MPKQGALIGRKTRGARRFKRWYGKNRAMKIAKVQTQRAAKHTRRTLRSRGTKAVATFIDDGAKFVPNRAPKLAVTSSFLHGLGVFAREDIPNGCRVGVLRGQEVKIKDISPQDHGRLYRGKHCKIYDAFKTRLNVLKNSNHSCEPNMEASIENNGDVWLFALRSISKDEELTWNYGCKPCKQDAATFICKCGAACCQRFYIL